MTSPFLQAYEIRADGAVALSGQAIADGLKDDKLAWVHLDSEHGQTLSWLEQEIAYLDPYIISALSDAETRPRVSHIQDGVLLILRGINLNPDEDAEDMVALRLYADAHRIITLERRPVQAVRDIAALLEAGKGPKSAGEFLSVLIHKLSQRVDETVAGLDDQTDDTEGRLITDDQSDLRGEIVNIRKQAIKIRRHLSPQRDALLSLRTIDLPWISDVDRRGIYESYNRTLRAVEELDAVRERAQIIKDEIANIISERMNRNTYVLSVIAAIFLPLGFLTGLLGINIGGLPGVDNPAAFLVFCAFMIVVVILQIIIFRKLKWF